MVLVKEEQKVKFQQLNMLEKIKIPFLGICFGMQMGIIEFARNKLKLKKAGSSELDKKCYPVIGLINEWDKNGKIIKGTDKDLGGTMRLGLYEAKLRNNSAINKIYKSNLLKKDIDIDMKLIIILKINLKKGD